MTAVWALCPSVGGHVVNLLGVLSFENVIVLLHVLFRFVVVVFSLWGIWCWEWKWMEVVRCGCSLMLVGAQRLVAAGRIIPSWRHSLSWPCCFPASIWVAIESLVCGCVEIEIFDDAHHPGKFCIVSSMLQERNGARLRLMMNKGIALGRPERRGQRKVYLAILIR